MRNSSTQVKGSGKHHRNQEPTSSHLSSFNATPLRCRPNCLNRPTCLTSKINNPVKSSIITHHYTLPLHLRIRKHQQLIQDSTLNIIDEVQPGYIRDIHIPFPPLIYKIALSTEPSGIYQVVLLVAYPRWGKYLGHFATALLLLFTRFYSSWHYYIAIFTGYCFKLYLVVNPRPGRHNHP